jgi:hypothetical protein
VNYKDIALEMHLTVMTIRKIERNALRKLSRRPGMHQLLEDYTATQDPDTLWDAIKREADE